MLKDIGLEIILVAFAVVSTFLLMKFKVERMEKDLERTRGEDRTEEQEWRKAICLRIDKFETDAWREIGKHRDFRHEFPAVVSKWQSEHEMEASSERLKIHEKVSDMRVAIAANEQKFEQIMTAIAEIKDTVNGLRK